MTTQTTFLANPKWQTNTIDSDAGSEYKYSWLFAIIWNAITWAAIVFGGETILRVFDENPVFCFFALFPVIGVWVVYRAIAQTLAWNKFGKTPLVMDPFPGHLGGSVGGYVDVPVPYDLTHQVKISLSCLHHYRRKNNGDNNKTVDAVWQDSIIIRPEPAINKTRIRFTFSPTAELPESQPDGVDTYVWEVHIYFPLPGHDFDRKFVIPVIRATEQEIALASRSTTISLEHVSRVVKPTKTRIPKITRSGNSTSFHYPLFRNKGLGIGLIIVGLLLGVFSWSMQQQGSDFMPITALLMFGVVALVTAALSLFGLYTLLHGISADVSPAGIEIKHKLLGFNFGDKIDAASIADIVTYKSGSTSGGKLLRVWYRLKVIEKDGQESSVGDSLEGSSYADNIRKKMIDSLGSRWSASEYPKKPASIKKRELPVTVTTMSKITSLAFPVAMLYDMRDLVLSLVQHLQTLLI
ncbi:MAG: hypothetical protein V3V22_00545 [Methylococcales bacterium]